MANFKSFCSRMWLDHCDENKTLYSNPLTYEEYIKRNWIWLLDKYSNLLLSSSVTDIPA